MINSDAKRRVGRQGLIMFAIAMLATSAFAIRLELTGSNLPSGITGPVELYRVVGEYDPPGGGDDIKIRLVNIVGGLLAEPAIPITVSGSNIPLVSGGIEKDPGTLNDISQNTKIYLRVWDGSIGQGRYYAQSAIKNVSWLETDPKVDWNVSTWIKYLADVPQGVGVKVNSESLVRTGASQTLTLGIATIDNGQTETLSAKLQISKDPNFTDVADTTGGTKSWDSAAASASGTYFTPATTFYIRGQKSNYYGSAPPALLTSPVQTIQQPGASVINAVGQYVTLGGGGANEQIDIILQKQTDGFGINSFATPFSSTYDGSGNPITNLKQLITAINAAGDGYATTIGYWSGQQEVGFTLDSSGNVLSKINTAQNPEEISVVRALGYQVSVTENKTLTLRNY